MNIVDLRKQYDRFINHYNGAKSELAVVAELRSVQKAVEEHLAEEVVGLQEMVNHHFYFQKGEKVIDTPKRHEYRFSQKAPIERLELPPFDFKSIHTIKALDWTGNTKKLLTSHYNSAKKLVHKDLHGIVDLDLRLAMERLEVIERVITKCYLIKRIIATSIVNDFPPKLSIFEDLTEEEQKKITARVGAPLNQDVPQGKVESIVDNLFRDQESGRVIVEVDGEKHAYQIIHQNGRWKGKANVNQIYKYFVTVHPDLDGLTDRQLKERIKKALPDDMK